MYSCIYILYLTLFICRNLLYYPTTCHINETSAATVQVFIQDFLERYTTASIQYKQHIHIPWGNMHCESKILNLTFSHFFYSPRPIWLTTSRVKQLLKKKLLEKTDYEWKIMAIFMYMYYGCFSISLGPSNVTDMMGWSIFIEWQKETKTGNFITYFNRLGQAGCISLSTLHAILRRVFMTWHHTHRLSCDYKYLIFIFRWSSKNHMDR